MKMTILRAQRSLEMDTDLAHTTMIPNIDLDRGTMTIYGEETDTGELFYIVLDKEAIDEIARMVNQEK